MRETLVVQSDTYSGIAMLSCNIIPLFPCVALHFTSAWCSLSLCAEVHKFSYAFDLICILWGGISFRRTSRTVLGVWKLSVIPSHSQCHFHPLLYDQALLNWTLRKSTWSLRLYMRTNVSISTSMWKYSIMKEFFPCYMCGKTTVTFVLSLLTSCRWNILRNASVIQKLENCGTPFLKKDTICFNHYYNKTVKHRNGLKDDLVLKYTEVDLTISELIEGSSELYYRLAFILAHCTNAAVISPLAFVNLSFPFSAFSWKFIFPFWEKIVSEDLTVWIIYCISGYCVQSIRRVRMHHQSMNFQWSKMAPYMFWNVTLS